MDDKLTESVPEEESFPEDAFTDDQRKNGAVLLHIIGTLYMIYAGIVLCYYFFVPSILLITRKVISRLKRLILYWWSDWYPFYYFISDN